MRGKKAKELRYLCNAFDLPYPVYKIIKKRYYRIPKAYRNFESMNQLIMRYADGFRTRLKQYYKEKEIEQQLQENS